MNRKATESLVCNDSCTTFLATCKGTCKIARGCVETPLQFVATLTEFMATFFGCLRIA